MRDETRDKINRVILAVCGLLVVIALIWLLSGCKAAQSLWDGITGASRPDPPKDTSNGTRALLWPLSAVGGLASLGGIVLLVISRGSRGWIPLIAGAVMIFANAAIYTFLDQTWFLVTVTITGLIALAIFVWQTYLAAKIKKKGNP